MTIFQPPALIKVVTQELYAAQRDLLVAEATLESAFHRQAALVARVDRLTGQLQTLQETV